MASLRSIKWQLLIMTGLGTYILLIAITLPYMWFYGQFSDVGHEMEYYSERADQMIPSFIFCLSPFVMYIIGRWLCERAGQLFYWYAILYFLTQEVIDILLVGSTGKLSEFFQPSLFVVYAAKLAGCLAAAAIASRTQKTRLVVE